MQRFFYLHITLFKHTLRLFVIMCALSSCQTLRDGDAYFNTYYNAKRLLIYVEDELDYVAEQQRKAPRSIIPQRKHKQDVFSPKEVLPFIHAYTVPLERVAPYMLSVDSIITKCSKVMAKNAQSNYIDDAMYLMARAYFLKSEWLPAQFKCEELIESYPESEYLAEAHLLLAMTYFLQNKDEQGSNMLSRTIDVAWRNENTAVLSRAFALQAELALSKDNVEQAMKPYRRAIAQSKNNTNKALWQNEMALLLFRQKEFAAAIKEFREVTKYTPDAVCEFESLLYTASSLNRLKLYDSANTILNSLEKQTRFEDWKGYISSERLNALRIAEDVIPFDSLLKIYEGKYASLPAIAAVTYERGNDLLEQGEYSAPRRYFAKAAQPKTQNYETANALLKTLNQYEIHSLAAHGILTSVQKGKVQISTIPDSTRRMVANSLYTIARLQEELGADDSALVYYHHAAKISPQANMQTAQYMYAVAQHASTKQQQRDSLLEIIFFNYTSTPYAQDARIALGYTDMAITDTLKEIRQSADRLYSAKEYERALLKYQELLRRFPSSTMSAARSLYMIGWIQHNIQNNKESALSSYKRLIKEYPTTEYAREVASAVTFADEVASGKRKADEAIEITKTKTDTEATAQQLAIDTDSTVNPLAPVQADGSPRKRSRPPAKK